MVFAIRKIRLPLSAAFLLLLAAGPVACGPGQRLFYVERNVPLPTRVGSAKDSKAARVRDRFYLLETGGPDGTRNDLGIERALGGDWPGARSLWQELLANRGNCRVRNNLALARYVNRKPRQAFATVRVALAECPADEKIRWNFRALARPTHAPQPNFRVLP